MVSPSGANSKSASVPVGIDLGTTYSLIAYLDTDGHPRTILNRHGEALTPSAVLFDEEEIVVGKEAVKNSVISPDAFAECFKRDMGDMSYRRSVRGIELPPEVLSAFVLERLKNDAEERIGPIRDVVITVPAFFDETRRKATQDAGRLAGLKVLDIINEPTAAAIAYGYTQANLDLKRSKGVLSPIKVLVYDLGGGTFDVTILEIMGQELRTVATDGDVQLGGRDFDERVVNCVADRFFECHGVDPRTDLQDAAQLWLDAREARHTLSELPKATIVCSHMGIRMRIVISRNEVNELTQDLIERTEITSSLVVKQAGLEWHEIDRVLLVGGCSRIPAVADMLQKLTGKEPDRSLSADEAIAHGAARYAGMLMESSPEEVARKRYLINVNSHSLGVAGIDPETQRRVNVIIIPKNTTLPHHTVRRFRTARTDQRNVQVPIVEGESHDPNECVLLGQCVVANLPAGLSKGTPVEVDFQYTTNGRVSVSARIPATRQSAHVEIKRPPRMDLGSLEIWRSRLSGTYSPVKDDRKTLQDGNTAKESSSRNNLLWNLDEMYAKVGRAAVRQPMPTSLAGSQSLAASAAKEAADARVELQKIAMSSKADPGSPQAMKEAADLSKANIRLRQAEMRCKFALIVLGRECVETSVEVPDVGNAIREIKRLRRRLGA